MGFHTYPVERADAVVADLGSGTGFYADDVAPFVETLYAVDVQPAMHDRYREKGVPDSVEFVTAEISSLPFEDGELDGAYSTMTHHEYASPAAADDPAAEDGALAELARVIRPGGRLVTVDWSADGDGESGPPLSERFSLAAATDGLEAAGFDIESARARPETIAIAATRT